MCVCMYLYNHIPEQFCDRLIVYNTSHPLPDGYVRRIERDCLVLYLNTGPLGSSYGMWQSPHPVVVPGSRT